MFSLITPTFNRAPILERTLTHLFAMDEFSSCEVIVIDDGSTDGTAELLRRFQADGRRNLKIITLTNGGPARARNHGVRAATFERILFIDDDVFPRTGMLHAHQKMLDAGYAVSQGLLLWHPEIAMTPLIRYIDSRGSQFNFAKVKDPSRLEFPYIYTGNCAMVRDVVRAVGGFDEGFFDRRFGFGAFEDTILGYRLQQRGAKMGLNLQAEADHLHEMTEEGYLRREYKVSYNIARLQHKYPDIARALGLEGKGELLPVSQHRVLRAMNSLPLLHRIAGYPLSMRLRHRQMFFEGILEFKRLNASAPREVET